MASYASIGLLTGFGKGVAQMGDTLFKQHLIEAEAKRKEHLEELRYKRDRADKLADYEMAREDRREDEKIKRGEAMQDTIWQTNFKQAMDTAKTDAERAKIAKLLEGESDPMKQAEKLRTAGFLDAATKVTASVPKPTETKLDPKTKTIVELLKKDMDNFGKQMSDPELSPDERERARSKYEEARRELYKMVGTPVPATSEGAGGDLTAIADRIQSQMGKGEAGSTTKTEPADVPRTEAGSSRSAGLLKQAPVQTPSEPDTPFIHSVPQDTSVAAYDAEIDKAAQQLNRAAELEKRGALSPSEYADLMKLKDRLNILWRYNSGRRDIDPRKKSEQLDKIRAVLDRIEQIPPQYSPSEIISP